MIQMLKRNWCQRTLREQRVLVLGGATLLTLILYKTLLPPFENWQQQQQQRRERALLDLYWMQQQKPHLEVLKALPAQPSGEKLSEAITASAARMHIALEHTAHVSWTLLPQPFAPLLTWLTQLEQEYPVQISRLSLQVEQASQISGTLEVKPNE
jgi:type II secretory pathway component PulM